MNNQSQFTTCKQYGINKCVASLSEVSLASVVNLTLTTSIKICVNLLQLVAVSLFFFLTLQN